MTRSRLICTAFAVFFTVTPLGLRAGELGAAGDLYVAAFGSNNVVQFDGRTGEFVGVFAELPVNCVFARPTGLAFGPDGNLFVCARDQFQVHEFDGDTGEYVGLFIDGNCEKIPPNPASGYLVAPLDLLFRPDGRLLVSADNPSVLEYEADTGEWRGTFALGGSPGGMVTPQALVEGPNGHIFVASLSTHEILEFHGTSGRLVRILASGEGVTYPSALAFGPNGNLFVSNVLAATINEFDGETGAHLGLFASGGGLTSPRGMTFGPNGNLFVTGKANSVAVVMEYDGTNGAVIGQFNEPVASSFIFGNPYDLVFKPLPPPSLPAPVLKSVAPAELDACDGIVQVTVTGANLDPDLTLVKLTTPGQPEILGITTGGRSDELIVAFDLGAWIAAGPRDVVAVNPDGGSDALVSAVILAACRAPTEGNLYILNSVNQGFHSPYGVFEVDGATGNVIGLMIEDPTPCSEYLADSTGLAFGYDGHVLIGEALFDPVGGEGGRIFEYDDVTGALLGAFIPSFTGGMFWPVDLTFGPNGNLFILHKLWIGPFPGGILEFDGLTGQFVREVLVVGACGGSSPTHFQFGPGWNIYVTDSGGSHFVRGGIWRVDGLTGDCVGEQQPFIPSPPVPMEFVDLAFPPGGGNLVAPLFTRDPAGAPIHEYDPFSGELLAVPIAAGTGQLEECVSTAFAPMGTLWTGERFGPVKEFDLSAGEYVGVFTYLEQGAGTPYPLFVRPSAGDADRNWRIDLTDFAAFQQCHAGADAIPSPYTCLHTDTDYDLDLDLDDLANFTERLTGP